MVNEPEDKIEFSFGWLALKLLGQNLYSNTWAAVSELVANGFDANAENVYVHIDARDKNNARIEILDDGDGMGSNDLRNYAIIGRRRREHDRKNIDDSERIMGRKGIGKLAALYLSENYYLVTKNEEGETAWHMNYDESRPQEDKPFLEKAATNPEFICGDIWRKMKTGTLLQMNNVNLKGLGDAAFESLRHKLANYFSLDSMGDRKILLRVLAPDIETAEFEVLEKKVAFGNMAFIDYNQIDSEELIKSIAADDKKRVLCAYPKIKNEYYEHKLEMETFGNVSTIRMDSGTPYRGTYTYEGKEYPYELKGWVGIHASIEDDIAKKNDELYARNKFYNPIQIRLYVRNKLAVENYLNIINLNQAFVNFVEGEVSFDILDHSDLPDIATTNRQSFDENDPRVEILTALLKRVVGDLRRKRENLGRKIKDKQDEMISDRYSSAKKVFSNSLSSELSRITKKDDRVTQEVFMNITNLIQGEIAPKDSYKLFISYCKYDKCISDFFYELLLHKKVKKEEIFYTENKDYKNLRPLGDQIRDNIIKDNTLMFFITGSDFRRSEMGLFEGGAGWATRTVGDYIVLAVKYEDIPGYLSNGKAEYTLLHSGTLALGRENYPMIVAILNRIIGHINVGRGIAMEPTIEEFNEEGLPSGIEIEKSGKSLENFMDREILEYWNHYVKDIEKEYLKDVEERNKRAKTIDTKEAERETS